MDAGVLAEHEAAADSREITRECVQECLRSMEQQRTAVR